MLCGRGLARGRKSVHQWVFERASHQSSVSASSRTPSFQGDTVTMILLVYASGAAASLARASGAVTVSVLSRPEPRPCPVPRLVDTISPIADRIPGHEPHARWVPAGTANVKAAAAPLEHAYVSVALPAAAMPRALRAGEAGVKKRHTGTTVTLTATIMLSLAHAPPADSVPSTKAMVAYLALPFGALSERWSPCALFRSETDDRSFTASPLRSPYRSRCRPACPDTAPA